MKQLLVSALLLIASTQVHATEVTSANLVGKYDLKAVVNVDLHLHLRVLNDKEFQLQRIRHDGRSEKVCDGTYRIAPETASKRDGSKVQRNIFRGAFTCPDDRSRNQTLDIDFTNKTVESFRQGTMVPLTSSVAPTLRIRALMRRIR
ncbi:MAG: hypothetical protein ACXVCP_12070 [Bdellovibrio sp.]